MASTTLLSDVQTVVTNVSGSTRFFGFLPYHGKKLENGESFTWTGNLDAFLNANKRRRQGFNAAVADGLIEVRANKRQILYGKVDNATAISIGDLIWYDTSDDEFKPASDFALDTDRPTTQSAFANKFAGVALAAHAASSGTVTDFPVDISPTSLYKRTCLSEAHQLDQRLAASPNTVSVANPTTQATVAATGGGATGGELAAGDYYVAYTFVSIDGETTIGTSVSAVVTVAATNIPRVTVPALPDGADSINIYVSDTDGSNTVLHLYMTGVTGTTADLADDQWEDDTVVFASAANKPSANTATYSDALENQQLEVTGTAARAIGRVARLDSSAATTAIVQFASAYFTANSAAQI